MIYFLDTDTCIFALKENNTFLQEAFQRFSPESIKIPSIVQAELLLGAQKSKNSKKVHQLIEGFLAPFQIISFCEKCAIVYAQFRYELEKNGNVIGPNDLIIAATTFAHHGTLITHNTKEFRRIKNLKIEDWYLS